MDRQWNGMSLPENPNSFNNNAQSEIYCNGIECRGLCQGCMNDEHEYAAIEVVNSLFLRNIRLVAFDFDYTFITLHTGGLWAQSADALSQYVRPVFYHLIRRLLFVGNRSKIRTPVTKYMEKTKKNHAHIPPDHFIVSIVTFSPQEMLIKKVFEILYSNFDLSAVFIQGNTVPFLAQIKNNIIGKEQHLAAIVYRLQKEKQAKIGAHEIILMDDDGENVIVARDFGHFAFRVDETVSLTAINNYLKGIGLR
ncbi:hypothetical protein SNEBB_005134 [Seison nebaliae]|nr:hypothetical protein SNEBB_005134 [Seison nebaliae]